MVACIETHFFTLTSQQCKNYSQVLLMAQSLIKQSSNNIKLYFVHPNSSETLIQTDSDLLSLKYIVKRGDIKFKAQVSKSKQEIEQELVKDEVIQYLTSTFDDIAQTQVDRQINEELEKYFQELYKKVIQQERKRKLKKIQKEEVDRYMNRMSIHINESKYMREVRSNERKSKTIRVSPDQKLFKRKQGEVEIMVKRVLQSMMPAMVKELSYRIVEEIKISGEKTYSKTASSFFERELNPEDL